MSADIFQFDVFLSHSAKDKPVVRSPEFCFADWTAADQRTKRPNFNIMSA